MGITLGYPPKAVDSYIAILCEKNEEKKKVLKWRRCYVSYYGFEFVCFVEHLKESAEWMWKQYPSTETLTLSYSSDKSEDFDVEYGDIDAVQRWVDHIETLIYLKSKVLVHNQAYNT
ncbi:hypothetical protein [Thermoflavimicrobium dichotomicum]|uniref:Uncharacterized protein n=1 Tax=Thermoflavimicrobium dichotomicum TaxID=46223 RepID=A0A1I3PAR5_9BACL|nr:hypothetical protein [Thermoflavimicrobium dichotomicum]SFJ18583.1 hypothetical protein SAMN05421852_105157 [Thermoflavimicrobium dichotomicum]